MDDHEKNGMPEDIGTAPRTNTFYSGAVCPECGKPMELCSAEAWGAILEEKLERMTKRAERAEAEVARLGGLTETAAKLPQ